MHDVAAAEALIDVIVAEARGDLHAAAAVAVYCPRQTPEQRSHSLRARDAAFMCSVEQHALMNDMNNMR